MSQTVRKSVHAAITAAALGAILFWGSQSLAPSKNPRRGLYGRSSIQWIH